MDFAQILHSSLFWAPFTATLLMCFSSALIGSILVIQKKSLLVETVSHASLLGLVVAAFVVHFFASQDAIITYLIGALIVGLISLRAVAWLEYKVQFPEDSALCFILSGFMGVGLLLASILQRTSPLQYKQMLSFLYGQPSLLGWSHCLLYAIFCFILVVWLIISFRSIKAYLFDKEFAFASGLASSFTEGVLSFISTFAIILGLKSVGVILLGGVLVSAAVTGKLLARKLSTLFIVAGLVGVVSACAGSFFSFWLAVGSEQRIVVSEGPLIVVASFICCFLAILFSKRQGLFTIFYRKRLQYHRILDENILKALWKETTCSVDLLSKKLGYTKNQIHKGMRHLRRQGLLEKNSHNLSALGSEKAEHIVRKHRLWECYQAYSLDKDISQLHQSAEEFEHIMDSKTENEIEEILSFPKSDPHQQPIPKGRR